VAAAGLELTGEERDQLARWARRPKSAQALALPAKVVLHLHFTPTGSSWINQVERWFGYLTDQMLRRGVHKSVQALEADIRAWISAWNESPRPFTWTKTAEEILESLAKYISKISGAAH
jgi:transposase